MLKAIKIYGPVIDARHLTRIYRLGDSEVIGINDPDIILADEPTGNLDSHNGQMVMELFAEMNRKWNRTVIIATHSNIADSLASMTICLKDGMITDQTCNM
jgi:ABC-type lipoprotein export system ATPase subunit